MAGIDEGKQAYKLACELYPICRSLTGNGVRQTLAIIQEQLPSLNIVEIPSGTNVYDWTVPDEWNIRDAWIEGPDGARFACFSELNLHVVGYSTPVDRVVDLDELLEHIHVQEDQPNVVPYVTSYYEPRYGFCMSKIQRDSLEPGQYHMFIDSQLQPGALTYADLVIPATVTPDEYAGEILFSTYVCHPSMANNELSGPVVSVQLAKWLQGLAERRYSYRFVFCPETIGSIAYISEHLAQLREHLRAGFVLTCMGDERSYGYVETRYANTYADRLARASLKMDVAREGFRAYSYLERGSDERQYAAPGVDLPVCTLVRSKFGAYDEYHTSADNLDLITSYGLQGSIDWLKDLVRLIEGNRIYVSTVLCEPQLGKRGLYSTLSQKGTSHKSKVLMDFLAYSDGANDLISIGDIIGADCGTLLEVAEILQNAGLIRELR